MSSGSFRGGSDLDDLTKSKRDSLPGKRSERDTPGFICGGCGTGFASAGLSGL